MRSLIEDGNHAAHAESGNSHLQTPGWFSGAVGFDYGETETGEVITKLLEFMNPQE